jgi:hypothetical protein
VEGRNWGGTDEREEKLKPGEGWKGVKRVGERGKIIVY